MSWRRQICRHPVLGAYLDTAQCLEGYFPLPEIEYRDTAIEFRYPHIKRFHFQSLDRQRLSLLLRPDDTLDDRKSCPLYEGTRATPLRRKAETANPGTELPTLNPVREIGYCANGSAKMGNRRCFCSLLKWAWRSQRLRLRES